ncbi:MAG: hypothetical protein KF784_09645 [Fimbriimonadaceae bacterium]|nr:hypothetical protein [Fimbriimonadaceae bacterium]
MNWVLAVAIALPVICCLAMVYYAKVVLPRRLQERFQESAKAFGTAIELRFPSHKGLTDRIVMLSHFLAARVGLTEFQLERLELACRLRDIGLCAIPYKLVNTREFKDWSDKERETYFKHGDVSGAMLELLPPLRTIADLVRQHHTTYAPAHLGQKISGKDLPIESRVLKVVSDYVWLEKWQGDILAREVLRDGRGADYDPDLVEEFLAVLRSNRVDSAQALA